jgi:hypothetical protein
MGGARPASGRVWRVLEKGCGVIEREICEVIAKHTLFSARELFDEWERCPSFDYLVALVGFSRVYGFADIQSAKNFLANQYLDVADVYNPPTQSRAHKGRWKTLAR